MCRTCRSQSDGMLLGVLYFASIFISERHFGLRLTYIFSFIWGFPSLSTLYSSYQDGIIFGGRVNQYIGKMMD